LNARIRECTIQISSARKSFIVPNAHSVRKRAKQALIVQQFKKQSFATQQIPSSNKKPSHEIPPKRAGYAIPKARRQRREHVPLDRRPPQECFCSLEQFATSFMVSSFFPRRTSKRCSSICDRHISQFAWDGSDVVSGDNVLRGLEGGNEGRRISVQR
jgi:hypothetical protein